MSTSAHPSSPAEGVRPLDRRRFMQYGGLGAALAVLAACGGESPAADGQVPEVGEAVAPTSVALVPVSDATLMRTAASLETTVIGVYDEIDARGLITTAAASDAVDQFRSSHRQHKAFFLGEALALDGRGYSEVNPRVQGLNVTPALEGLTDEVAALDLAFRIESILADSYQLFVPELTTPELRVKIMSVGAVTARHVGALVGMLSYGLPTPLVAAVVPEVEGAPTTLPPTTMAGAVVPDPVYAVPGAFGSTATGVGPSAYV